MLIPFLLDEKPTVVPVSSAGEQSGGAQEVPYGAARSEFERTVPAWGWQAVFGCQLIWNGSSRRAEERGGARDGRPKWLRILTITGGSSMAAQSCGEYSLLC